MLHRSNLIWQSVSRVGTAAAELLMMQGNEREGQAGSNQERDGMEYGGPEGGGWGEGAFVIDSVGRTTGGADGEWSTLMSGPNVEH